MRRRLATGPNIGYNILRVVCACDGIGRHARFRFSCRKTCGFESLQAHVVGRSLLHSASACAKAPYPQAPSSSQNRNRSAGFRFWFFRTGSLGVYALRKPPNSPSFFFFWLFDAFALRKHQIRLLFPFLALWGFRFAKAPNSPPCPFSFLALFGLRGAKAENSRSGLSAMGRGG